MSARQAIWRIPVVVLVCSLLFVSIQESEGKNQEQAPKRKRGAIGGVKRSSGPEPYQLGNREVPDLSQIFEEKTVVMIPMRDGIKLYTEIYHPKGFTEPLPIILERTPYHANPGYQKFSPRLSYSFAAAVGLDTWKSPLGLYIDKRDEYEWFLDVGPLSNINDRYLHGISPTWNAFVEHPNLDDTWRCGICGVLPHVNEVTVPALHVTGWYDPEDFYGPIQVYKKLEKKDERDQNFLVLGPWYHGGWTFEESGNTLGPLDLESDTARHFRDEIHLKWFTYWLKDKGELPLGEALTFQMGSNEWQYYKEWPPKEGIEIRNLYLHPEGQLSFETPSSDSEEDFDSYISDPANPVPFRYRPYLYPWGWQQWTLEDQCFVHRRTDVLSWVSEPLEEDFSITGEPIAQLFASTSGEDCDWVVKLIDVFPEKNKVWDMRGYQLIVGAEVFRARFRNSFEVPEPVVPNIFKAKAEDFQKVTQRIYQSKSFPTHISLPVNIQNK